MAEENKVVKVLVGQKRGGSFPGFWAEFEGDEVSSYEDPRSGKNAVYTLYRCTAYTNEERYRVHIADESNPANPVYELRPDENPYDSAPEKAYHEPYYKEAIEEKYPLFLKDLDLFETRSVDAKPGVSRGYRG